MQKVVLPTVTVLASLGISVFAFWHDRNGIGVIFVVVAIALFALTLILETVGETIRWPWSARE